MKKVIINYLIIVTFHKINSKRRMHTCDTISNITYKFNVKE